MHKILAHKKARKIFRWLTFMDKEATHRAKWQSTRDFIYEDRTPFAAAKDHTETAGWLSDVLKRVKKLQKDRWPTADVAWSAREREEATVQKAGTCKCKKVPTETQYDPKLYLNLTI